MLIKEDGKQRLSRPLFIEKDEEVYMKIDLNMKDIRAVAS